MTRWFWTTVDWFEHRLRLRESVLPMLKHPVPRGLGWWYVFGTATLSLFLLQVVTGTCLALIYVPSADSAYESLLYLNYSVTLGWYLRAVHNWGGGAMLVMMILHMSRVWVTAAYKYPRELTWLVGVGLFVCVWLMLFTGQILRWDSDGFWTLGIAAAIAGRFPLIAEGLTRLILEGPVEAAGALSRFFTLHVFWIPGALISLLVVHLYLVLKLGISALPVPGQPDEPQRYQERYEAKLRRGEPFWPHDFSKDLIFSSLTILVVLLLALVFGPEGPGIPPDPTIVNTNPRPDWPFRWIFALLALSPPHIESLLMVGILPLMGLILILVPFVGKRGERAPTRRPLSMLLMVLVFLSFGVLTWLGYATPWAPHMDAWSGNPLAKARILGKDQYSGKFTPAQLQGAVLFQHKTCRNCHAIDGLGGQKGPPLDNVATYLDRGALIRQIEQGGVNMPPFGRQISPPEIECLVSFLQTLRPKGEQPAPSPLLPQPERVPSAESAVHD
jgi:ubiquinol-cytochrome c reductase cytochrome b subunit